MFTIYLVDDHTLLRDGLAHLLERESDFRICGQAATGAEALEQIPARQPDLVILDISLPDRNGLELLKDLQNLCPETQVLVLSMHDETLYAERVIRAGARGYLTKGSAKDRLIPALRRILDGQIALTQEASSFILGGMAGDGRRKSRSRMQSLTDREFEVFERIGAGKDIHEIADALGISPRTVEAHRTHIREKLDLDDAAALLRYAVRWVETGEIVDPGDR
jgi:DNA-binding NarL/FixJ family response regulator